MKNRDRIVLAAISDIHCTKSSAGTLQSVFEEMNEKADIVVICGDLTDYGLPSEAKVLAKELSPVKVPIVAVLGNHDFEADRADELKQVLEEAGVRILDGESCEIEGIGFAGTKGFGGGFGEGMLEPWGESVVKQFVQESANESVKLESSLSRLNTKHRIAILHYSPIEETLEGEPPVIYPYLGSSRLEDPLARHPVTAVFHGHAHHGSLEGMTRTQVPVFNVAMPLLRRMYSAKSPYRLLALPL